MDFRIVVQNPSKRTVSGWWGYVYNEAGEEVFSSCALTKWGNRRQCERWIRRQSRGENNEVYWYRRENV